MKNKWLLFFIMPLNVFADELITTNIQNGCSASLNTNTYLYATFTRTQYQCSSGYYLPANTDHCVACPDIYDCPGGTYTFNEEIDQGNKFKKVITTDIMDGCREDFTRAYNNSANIIATFTPNVHTCLSGYYLPANIDECTACPAHTVCAGGTYTFNETTTQGITGCESGYNLQNNVCVGNIIIIDWSDADAADISANNAGTMTYGGDIRTPRAAIDKTNIGLRFKGWVFNKPIQQ